MPVFSLTDLNLNPVRMGWDIPPHINRTVKGTPLSVGGRAYPTGIWLNAPCRIVLRLDGKARRFNAACGHEDLVQSASYPAPRIRFSVIGDGMSLYDSGFLNSGEAARQLDVNLEGVRCLELLLDSENGIVGNAQGDWLDPVIEYDGLPPVLEIADTDTEPDPGPPQEGYDAFYPGQRWYDTQGTPIQAHGAGLLKVGGVYYLYGEHKGGPTSFWPKSRVDIIGVGVYSSTDLTNWKFESVVLPAEPDQPDSPLHPSNVLERPKVLYNPRTGKFVLWVKSENAHYEWSRALVATADHPCGPFKIQDSFRPGGRKFGDFNLYQEDGHAFMVFSSGGVETQFLVRLTEDYLQVATDVAAIYPGQKREAPALVKHAGLYYLLTSGKSGWAPNPTRYAVASSLQGPWEDKGLLFSDDTTRTSHRSQPTFLLEHEGRLIYLGDRWNQRDLGDSRYVWLPVEVSDGKLSCRWHDSWKL